VAMPLCGTDVGPFVPAVKSARYLRGRASLKLAFKKNSADI